MHFFFAMAAQKASAKVAVVNVSGSSKESEGNSPVSKVTSYMPATYWRRKSSIDIFHENFSCELPIIIRITLNIYCWKIDFTRAYRQNNWNIVQQDCFEVNLQSWTSYFWYFTNFFFHHKWNEAWLLVKKNVVYVLPHKLPNNLRKISKLQRIIT